MSATNASGISSAKHRTLTRFLILYGIMSIVILSLLGSIYYQYAQAQMIASHRLAMQLQSESYVPELKQWLEKDRTLTTFPKDLAYATALYGYDQKLLVGNLSSTTLNFKEPISFHPPHIHLIVALAPYGMGEFYLVFEAKDDGLWKIQTIEHALIGGTILFIFLLLIGYLLSRMLLRPINDAVALLDDFIKDTTHELNTPISAILTNLESIDSEELNESTRKKLKRIGIASRTISTLYDDLTYLVLNHDLSVSNTDLDLGALLTERLEYFKDRIEQKKITLHLCLRDPVILCIDRTKATRILDNLLSNAIKYNTMGGSITITLNTQQLCIEDTGVGIPQEMIERVFERYTRANKSVGGFGIGLNIVAMIAKEYGIEVSIESQENRGTTISLTWPNTSLS